MRKNTEPPKHLTQDTATWWRAVVADFELEPHHLRLLQLAAEAWDRCRQARELLAAEGLCVATADGGRKAHPAVAIERDARLAFARLVRELDLDHEAPPDRARPPALRSNR